MTSRGFRAAYIPWAAALLIGAALPQTAHAHPSEMHGFLAGFLHPWTGADHLAAMLAVGWWAALRSKESLWELPMATLAGVIAGSCAAVASPVLQVVEAVTVPTIIALGLLISIRPRVGRAAALAIAACCGSIHGYAHGAQLQVGGAVWSTIAGFVLATSVLQLTGVLVCAAMLRHHMRSLVRAAGAGIAVVAALVLAVG